MEQYPLQTRCNPFVAQFTKEHPPQQKWPLHMYSMISIAPFSPILINISLHVFPLTAHLVAAAKSSHPTPKMVNCLLLLLSSITLSLASSWKLIDGKGHAQSCWFMALDVVDLGTSPISPQYWQFGHLPESLGSQENVKFCKISFHFLAQNQSVPSFHIFEQKLEKIRE